MDAPLGQRPNAGQVDPIVDAQDRLRVVDREGRDAVVVAPEDLEDVGEVVLALGVVGLHALERREEARAVEGVDAGIDLTDPQLGLVGVARRLGLGDVLDAAVGAAHDPAIAGGIVELDGGDGGRGAAAGVGLQDGREQLRGDQGRVAVDDQDGRVAFEALGGRQHGVAGAARLALDGQLDTVGESAVELAAGAAHHHHPARPGLDRRPDRPLHHGPPADLVQHLGHGGSHAGALPGGQDDDGGRGHPWIVAAARQRPGATVVAGLWGVV